MWEAPLTESWSNRDRCDRRDAAALETTARGTTMMAATALALDVAALRVSGQQGYFSFAVSGYHDS